MTNTKKVVLAIGIAFLIGLGGLGYSHIYFWRSVDNAVIQKNSQPYPTARVYKSAEGVILIQLDRTVYLYFPETQRIGMLSGGSFLNIGPLLFSNEAKPQVFWADGVKVEKADLYATDDLIEFSDTLDGRVRVTF